MAKVRSFRLASRQDVKDSANLEPPKPRPPTLLERSDAGRLMVIDEHRWVLRTVFGWDRARDIATGVGMLIAGVLALWATQSSWMKSLMQLRIGFFYILGLLMILMGGLGLWVFIFNTRRITRWGESDPERGMITLGRWPHRVDRDIDVKALSFAIERGERPKDPPFVVLLGVSAAMHRVERCQTEDEALAYIASLPPIFAHAKDASSSMRQRDGAESSGERTRKSEVTPSSSSTNPE
ncbi:MAG: hypothetical protein H6812_08595 [Phycisphaeraceae bacterium]|nr:hypothetical protein [Phycisphaerales bacterium]MCB9843301.1 hypothetical protein [Phycisphaeraceae bacterium]